MKLGGRSIAGSGSEYLRRKRSKKQAKMRSEPRRRRGESVSVPLSSRPTQLAPWADRAVLAG